MTNDYGYWIRRMDGAYAFLDFSKVDPDHTENGRELVKRYLPEAFMPLTDVWLHPIYGDPPYRVDETFTIGTSGTDDRLQSWIRSSVGYKEQFLYAVSDSGRIACLNLEHTDAYALFDDEGEAVNYYYPLSTGLISSLHIGPRINGCPSFTPEQDLELYHWLVHGTGKSSKAKKPVKTKKAVSKCTKKAVGGTKKPAMKKTTAKGSVARTRAKKPVRKAPAKKEARR